MITPPEKQPGDKNLPLESPERKKDSNLNSGNQVRPDAGKSKPGDKDKSSAEKSKEKKEEKKDIEPGLDGPGDTGRNDEFL